MNKKKKLICGITILSVILSMVGIWHLWFSTTKIAFVNYQVIELGQINKSNDNSFIELDELPLDNLNKLPDYDMVFINAMGLRITEDQRSLINEAAEKGIHILTTAATNPDNKIISIDSLQADSLTKYLGNGKRVNYRSMLNYVRKNIDKKAAFINDIKQVVKNSNNLLYHYNLADKEDDDLGFNTISDYNAFLKKNNLLKDGAPRIIITGRMGVSSDLMEGLEKAGCVVYGVNNMKSLIESQQVDSIHPSALINMAHGRMGDYIVDYLSKANIPMFAPLNVNRLVVEWEKDKQGMNGGFLSQSIVTPEIDGAIRPFALFGHYLDKEGLQHAYAIPERLETFVETVMNYISLQRKNNSQKKVAIYYYKGPGQNALTASGMEVVPSLYNLLKFMKQEGYKVDNLPSSSDELGKMIQKNGAVFNSYAEGAFDKFMKEGNPALVNKKEYESWIKRSIRPENYAEIIKTNGEFPGDYMSTKDGSIGVARIQFGNVVLLPQSMAAQGNNAFKIVHGADVAPPHTYIASYLWTRFGFKADALIHFGTHGSLEFTPKKQVALSSNDWPDRLVGSMPHFYIYSIGNVGEGMIAKRRSYAGLQSYLTPPFLESSVRGIYRELMEKIKIYNNFEDSDKESNSIKTNKQKQIRKTSLDVKRITVQLGIHRELELDSVMNKPYSEDEIARIENFAEELATEKITGQLYTMGVPYEKSRIESSVYAMATDPIAYGLLALDKEKGKEVDPILKHKTLFNQYYLNPARELVTKLMNSSTEANDMMVCDIANISISELEKARQIDKDRNAPKGMMAMMMAMNNAGKKEKASTNGKAHTNVHKSNGSEGKESHASGMEKSMKSMLGIDSEKALAMAKKMGASEDALKKMEAEISKKEGSTEKPASKMDMMKMMSMKMPKAKEYSKKEVNMALAIMEVERTIKNVGKYRTELIESPYNEFKSLENALNGGYTKPSPGGDPIVNPNTLPTGRNMYAIDAETTPSESAWDKGVKLAENTIEMYKRHHNDSLPRKVSYTLWSGEFIETGGATIAQVLYMLGVEPIRDAFGRVSDIRLIPSKQLGRPRIDVVVQTSGQLRDLAASRLFLVNRAVEMAAQANDDLYENQVKEGVIEAERTLIEKGLSPKDAREISTFRVFGGANGGYGTGIQGMVMSGDRWSSEKEIADTYLNNMGAYYGNEKNWEVFQKFAFEAALTRTDAVIQPRQSNTWGALSLDHVSEFMGGLNLTVRNVTGKDPDAYFSDYRNRNNARMQDIKEAIGVESRTTIFNPTYIKEKMKGEASSANTFAEIVQNTYSWNVMKPKAIDKEMWDEIYNVYVKDKFNLNTKEYFEKQNPAALEEMTAVMMETARKGMWKASKEQLSEIAKLHIELVNKYKPSCSGFVCDNAKLREFISSKADARSADEYKKNINEIRQTISKDSKKGVVMKKNEINPTESEEKANVLNNGLVAIGVVVVLIALILLMRNRRKKMQQ